MNTARLMASCMIVALLSLTGGCGEQKRPVPPTPPPDRAPAPKPEPIPLPPPDATPTPAAPTDGPAATFADDAALIRALRAGGYIIALRHTHTDMTQKDDQGTNYQDCAKQRNLDDQGRSEARSIGRAISLMNIAISEVLTSPFCRNKETAQLAFGHYSINNACMGEDPDSIAARARLLSTAPPEFQNILIVTHRHSMAASTGTPLDMYVEGGALVIIPRGEGKFDIVHTIALEDWDRLAKVGAELNE